jgi:hypothetical protein
MDHVHAIFRYLRQLPRFTLILLLRGYQVMLSPLLIGSCKFHPTCSEYCIQAVREWGVFRGGWMGFRRVIRCHPFGFGGLDPVPPRKNQKPPQRDTGS